MVGTPGRLIDLMNRRALDISHVKSLVLDEADEMLDLGFLPDVERLLKQTPETRQTMLFSATMPAAIVALARTHMRHPMNIRAESSADTQMVPATAQFIYQAHDLDKPEMLGRLLQAEGADLMIVFTRTKRQAQRIADDLEERGFSSAPLHGDMAQAARERALTKFRDGKLQVLVATDVAARGIDVTGVTHVVNYTCPEDEKTYVHRIGRTGRAGATGIAITFVDWADLHRWKMINKALDLPFDDPQETYSSSENFLHDQGIAPGIKGRLVPEGTIERKPRPERSDRGGKGGGGRVASTVAGTVVATDAGRVGLSPSTKAARRRQPARSPATVRQRKRNRSRRRTRGGQSGRGRRELSRAQAVTTTFVPTGAKFHSRMASGSACRMQPCDCGVPSCARVCSRWPSLVGMLWNPIAALSPRVKRTKYCITPESSTPTAQRERE